MDGEKTVLLFHCSQGKSKWQQKPVLPLAKNTFLFAWHLPPNSLVQQLHSVPTLKQRERPPTKISALLPFPFTQKLYLSSLVKVASPSCMAEQEYVG